MRFRFRKRHGWCLGVRLGRIADATTNPDRPSGPQGRCLGADRPGRTACAGNAPAHGPLRAGGLRLVTAPTLVDLATGSDILGAP